MVLLLVVLTFVAARVCVLARFVHRKWFSLALLVLLVVRVRAHLALLVFLVARVGAHPVHVRARVTRVGVHLIHLRARIVCVSQPQTDKVVANGSADSTIVCGVCVGTCMLVMLQ